MRVFSIVEVTDAGEYGIEFATADHYEDAVIASNNAYREEGMHTDILKLHPLKDVYGVESGEQAWIPVEVLRELGLEV